MIRALKEAWRSVKIRSRLQCPIAWVTAIQELKPRLGQFRVGAREQCKYDIHDNHACVPLRIRCKARSRLRNSPYPNHGQLDSEQLTRRCRSNG